MALRIALQRGPTCHVPRRCLLFLHCRPQFSRSSSHFSHLRESIMLRRLGYSTDFITPIPSRSLRLTLASHLPFLATKSVGRREDAHLTPASHLVYFPAVHDSYLLLPDGTLSLYSPGRPFTRSMWAGGRMTFLKDIPTDGEPFHANENILDVHVKGRQGEEKVFVKMEKIIFAGLYPRHLEPQPPRIVDERTLVYMRGNCEDGSPTVSQHSSKILKPAQIPDFSHTMIPTREFLFRFSALTFNAHAIHLDRQFCREVEGHRNLLVHGPLTVVLMIEVLQTHLQDLADHGGSFFVRAPEVIREIEYKNLAPLYADEEMKICVKKKQTGGQERFLTWDVWIQGRDGGYAVKGLVRTLSSFSPRRKSHT